MNFTITKQQRNFFLLCAAVAVVYYVAHTIETYALQAAYYRQQATHAAQQRDKALAQAKAQKEAPPVLPPPSRQWHPAPP